jgi:ribose transport system permease protein
VTRPEELVDAKTPPSQRTATGKGAGSVNAANTPDTGQAPVRRYAGWLAFALGWRGLPTTVLAVAAAIAIVILQPAFLSTTQLTPFLATYAPIAVLAVGVSFTLLVGGIDLSVGPVMGVCGIMTVLLSSVGVHLFTAGPSGAAAVCADPRTCSQGLPFVLVIVLVIAVGALFGLVNGLVIAYVRLQPLVATLAMGFVAAGFSLYMLPQPGGQIPAGLLTRYGRPALLSAPLVLLAVFTVGAYLLMRTPLGVRMRAVGSHRWKAFTSGVQVPRATVSAYVAAGASAGIAGLLFALNAGSADPSVGVSYTLTAVAGAVLGGTALRGGWAEPFGPVSGAVTLGLLAELVTVANVPTYYSQLATGLIILAGLALAQVILRRWNKTS